MQLLMVELIQFDHRVLGSGTARSAVLEVGVYAGTLDTVHS